MSRTIKEFQEQISDINKSINDEKRFIMFGKTSMVLSVLMVLNVIRVYYNRVTDVIENHDGLFIIYDLVFTALVVLLIVTVINSMKTRRNNTLRSKIRIKGYRETRRGYIRNIENCEVCAAGIKQHYFGATCYTCKTYLDNRTCGGEGIDE